MRRGVRELINEDGRPFVDEIDQVTAELAGLPNDDREDFRNRNSSAIACHPARRLLIVAGPGSGKSFLFLDRIRHWLAQDASARIYVSTFVRKLVNDLLNEIEVKLDSETAKQVNGSTLHSLARSILERSGGTSDLSLAPYVKVIAGDHWERVVWRDVLAFHPGVTGHTIGAFKAHIRTTRSRRNQPGSSSGRHTTDRSDERLLPPLVESGALLTGWHGPVASGRATACGVGLTRAVRPHHRRPRRRQD